VNHASSKVCSNQLFTYGANVIGLQFHLEATPSSIAAMVKHDGHELVQDRYIQSAAEILDTTSFYHSSNLLMQLVLERLFR
jgi:hypothetical protein